MSSIRDEPLALDTNEFVFALRQEPNYPACRILLFDRLPELTIYLPLQILIELDRNLSAAELRRVFQALGRAQALIRDYTPARPELVAEWERRGAKKGDAVIAAHLDANDVHNIITENRHFLVELADLPFEVLTSAEALSRLR